MHLKPKYFIIVAVVLTLVVGGIFLIKMGSQKPNEQPTETTTVESTTADETTTKSSVEVPTLIPPVIMTTEPTTEPPTTEEPTTVEPTTKKPEPTTAEPTTQPPTTQPPTTRPEPTTEEVSVPERIGDKDTEELVDEVLAGKWGNGQERKNRLNAAGYDYKIVQAAVNRRLGYVEQEID